MVDVLKQELATRLDKFAEEAVLLSEAINAADAEELVCDGYPFDKSFDELSLDILNWRDAVKGAIYGTKIC